MLSLTTPAISNDEPSGLLDSYYSYLQEIDAINAPAMAEYKQVDHTKMRLAFENFYGPLESMKSLDSFSPIQLRITARALYTLNFHSPTKEYAIALAAMIDAIEHDTDHEPADHDERSANPPALQSVYESLVMSRVFDEARDFAKNNQAVIRFSWLDAIREDGGEESSGKPAVISLRQQETGIHATIDKIDLDSGPLIIAAVHPQCGPSRRAMDHILSNPELRDIFQRSIWITGQHEASAELILKWNSEPGNIPISIVHEEHLWPAHITFKGTPVFYFLDQGEVESMVIGWPADDQANELFAAWRRIAP